jgi:hypothetical protein
MLARVASLGRIRHLERFASRHVPPPAGDGRQRPHECECECERCRIRERIHIRVREPHRELARPIASPERLPAWRRIGLADAERGYLFCYESPRRTRVACQESAGARTCTRKLATFGQINQPALVHLIHRPPHVRADRLPTALCSPRARSI